MDIWHAIGRQLEHPEGLAGRILGRLMLIANDRPTGLAVDALGLEPGDRVLDLGCGSGHALALIARQAANGQTFGIDQSEAMVRQASRHNRGAIDRGQMHLSIGHFEVLPYADASLDKVLASNVIYFWRDPVAVLSEIRRVLRPGGGLVIYATDAATMARWKFATSGTHRLVTRSSIRAALGSASFDMKHTRIDEVRIARRVQGIVAVTRKAE